jgi:hypothetical protein
VSMGEVLMLVNAVVVVAQMAAGLWALLARE